MTIEYILEKSLIVWGIKGVSAMEINFCPQCNSADTDINVARTIFCKDCNLSTTRMGNTERMVTHPLHPWFKKDPK